MLLRRMAKIMESVKERKRNYKEHDKLILLSELELRRSGDSYTVEISNGHEVEAKDIIVANTKHKIELNDGKLVGDRCNGTTNETSLEGSSLESWSASLDSRRLG
ncbi:hypothetical protein Tco_1122544 [Tanacetum coccineum]|uniref:Uncharacterized protein n=1 Tax=Tanacetum coccineum TaxID=301880 RepID=A0ABQ5J0V8_9ASTR